MTVARRGGGAAVVRRHAAIVYFRHRRSQRKSAFQSGLIGSLEAGKQFDAVMVDGPAVNLLRVNAQPITHVFKKGNLVHVRQ